MKTKRVHRVPLSKQAMAVIAGLDRSSGSKYLFPSPSKGVTLSDATMGKLMKEMGYEAVPHGFRSTFKGYTKEETDFEVVVVQDAMSHSTGNKLEEAYTHTDAFRKRMRLMQDWADFIDNPPEDYKNNVIPINAPLGYVAA